MVARRWRAADGRPLVIGIGGGSGSGKSTVAGRLAGALEPARTEVIGLDGYFKPVDRLPTYRSAHHGQDRPDFNRPDSFRVGELLAACHRAAAPAVPEMPGSADIVVIEGILALHFAVLRPLLHLRCYVTAPVEQMLARRTARNLAAGYGGGAEEIAWYNRECVVPRHRRWNAPSAAHADVLVPNGDGEEAAGERALAEIVAAVRAVRAR